MIASPIVTFELRHGTTDASLVELSAVNLKSLNADQAHKVHLQVRSAAEKGSPFAMCLCARWPATHGRDKPTDKERFSWAGRAALTDYPPGLFELGLCFEKGIGAPLDLARALTLYERSSAGGFGFASHRLGIAYMDGHFGTVDAPRAIALMELAYQQGEAFGALQLGQWLEAKDGVTADLAAAASWYERASEMGNFFATQRLQMAYMLGELGLPRDANMAKRYEARLIDQTEVTSHPSQR
jgi:TPR repeat protein